MIKIKILLFNIRLKTFASKFQNVLHVCLFLLLLLFRLKTWLRSRMGESRLTGLALLHTHKYIVVNIYNVINRFANEKKRNVKLLL
jgi:hypothetical protein